jgi:hypothetical protein
MSPAPSSRTTPTPISHRHRVRHCITVTTTSSARIKDQGRTLHLRPAARDGSHQGHNSFWQAALSVRWSHRRVLRNSVAWSLLILKDPASSLLDQHAAPPGHQPMLRSEEPPSDVCVCVDGGESESAFPRTDGEEVSEVLWLPSPPALSTIRQRTPLHSKCNGNCRVIKAGPDHIFVTLTGSSGLTV